MRTAQVLGTETIIPLHANGIHSHLSTMWLPNLAPRGGENDSGSLGAGWLRNSQSTDADHVLLPMLSVPSPDPGGQCNTHVGWLAASEWLLEALEGGLVEEGAKKRGTALVELLEKVSDLGG